MRRHAALSVICLAALSACASALEAPKFVDIEHTTRPLIQEGSDNLLSAELPPADLEGWGPKNDVSIAQVDGEQVLRFGPMREDGEGEGEAMVEHWVRPVKPATLYRLSFDLLIPTDARLPVASHSGFYGWLAQYGEQGGLPGSLRMNDYRRSGEWMPREEYLFTHADVQSMRIELRWFGEAGEMLVRRIRLVEAPVAGEEGRVILETASGDWAELPDRVPPGEAPDDAMLWALDDADTLRPNSLPPAGTERSFLQLRGTEGEVVVGAVGLWTPRRLEDVTVSIEPGDQATSALDVAPEVRWMVFLPRRTDHYGRGRTFHYVPDFFLDTESIDCPAGEATGLWISYRIPEGAAMRPDTRWLLKARGDGFEAAIPVNIAAYGFSLADLPEKVRHLYLDTGRWRERTDAQVLAEIADVRDHGYESVPLAAQGRFVVEDGQVTDFEPYDYTERFMRLAQEGGLRGPFGFWTGRFPQYLRAALELPEDALEGYADTWPEELFQAEVQAMRALKEDITAAGIEDPFTIAIDEPGYWKAGSPERYAWDMRVAAESGWDSYCTTSVPPPDPLGLHVTYHCYGGGQMSRDPQVAAEILEVTHAHDQRCWYYCTGAYSGQIGNMLRNRYLAGFMFFRSGWDGTASWTFQRPRGNPFDDFGVDDEGNQRSSQSCVTYPDPRADAGTASGNLDTPHWEGLRQSWYDHRYAATLQSVIDELGERDPDAAGAAQERLDALMGALPWSGNMFMDGTLTNARLDETRRAIAQEIERLAGR